MKNILFICTGNYYRSRFAEQYFNHLAQEHELSWQADSKGLKRDMDEHTTGNKGSLSAHAIEYLENYGVSVDQSRKPCSVQAEDFSRFQKVIALSRAEHYPMMQQHFSEFADSIGYFNIDDLHIEDASQAIPKLASTIEELIQNLQNKV